MIPILGTILSSLFKKYSTVAYPAAPMEPRPEVRGSIACDIETCILCGICQRRCPTGAITVSKPGGSWAIQRLACIQCGNCVGPCPKKCLALTAEPPRGSLLKEDGVVSLSSPPKPSPSEGSRDA